MQIVEIAKKNDFQPKNYVEFDAFINNMSRQAWREFIAAYVIGGNAMIVELIRRKYPNQFLMWRDKDLFHYLSERKLSDFVAADERMRS